MNLLSRLFGKKNEKPHVELWFYANRKIEGGKPVSFRNDGKVYIIDWNSSSVVSPGERWRCRILEEQKNKIIIDPVAPLSDVDRTV